MGIPQVRISADNKHANGVVEQGHFMLHEAIIKSCEKSLTGQAKNWPDYVSPTVFADRVTVNKVTGYSPYCLLHYPTMSLCSWSEDTGLPQTC